MDRKGLEELQNKRIRRIVDHAYRNVPYYHDAFSARRITPETIDGVKQLGRLPTLTRQMIEENYPSRLLAPGVSAERVVVRRTSGTTGRPMEIVWDSEYCDMMAASRLMIMRSIGSSVFDRAVEIMYAGPLGAGPRRMNSRSRLRRILIGPISTPTLLTLRSKKLAFHESILEVEEALREFRPAAANSRPSYLRRLGVHLQSEGRSLQISKLVTGGEYLSDSVRKDLEGLFSSEVFDALGAQEFGALGMECSEHAGIHLFSDCFAFEFLKDGESASAGESAELVVTSLFNESMPLIRYRLGDTVVPEPEEECACGLSLPKLREISGRPDDGLQLPGGTRVPVGPVVDRIEEMGFRDYQLLQTGEKAVTVKLVEKQIGDEWTRRLLSYVRSVLGEDVQIKLEQWKEDEIPPKYRPVLRQFLTD